MLKEKAGNVAGQIWTALNLSLIHISEPTRLREDKVSTSEVEGELFVKLN